MRTFGQPLGRGVRVRGAGRIGVVVALVAGLGVTALANAASAAPAPLYAYAEGSGAATGCPEATTSSDGCSLAAALSQVAAGGTVYLATPAATASYVGNWTVVTPGTSPAEPVTIEPAPAVVDPTLDGDDGGYGSEECSTPGVGCSGPVLYLGAGTSVTVEGITIQNAYANYGPDGFSHGGAIDTGDGDSGGTLTVSGVTFYNDDAEDGGAIDSGDSMNGPVGGSGTVVVTDSTFDDDGATYGGAIDNGTDGGTSSLTVSDSTFVDDGGLDGGAIDSGDLGGGSVSVSDSTFEGNFAQDGVIDSGDTGGGGSVSVTDSTFSDAGSPEIYNAGNPYPYFTQRSDDSVFVAGDVFDGSCQQAESPQGGTWSDGGYNVGIDTSCFGSASPTGDAVDASLGSDLGSLAANGGPTETMLPAAGASFVGVIPDSPATTVSSGSASVQLCPRVDQRGVASSGDCTAGAVEAIPGVTPSFTSPDSASFAAGEAGTFTVTTSGGTPAAATFSLSADAPSWLSIGSSSGVLSGIPPAGATGTYSFVITASNGVGSGATQAFTLSIASPPAITSPSTVYLPWLARGSVRLTATGTPTPTLSKTGALPVGLEFTAGDATGTATISGTAGLLALGSHTITLTASNGVEPDATQVLTVVVGFAPRFLTPPAATFSVGHPGRYLVATLGAPTASLAESGTLPSGVSFVDNGNGTATISGTPASGTAGTFALTLSATNGVGTSSQTFTLGVDVAPSFSSAGLATFTVGHPGTFTVTATGSPSPAITVGGSLPRGVTFEAGHGTATFSGTPQRGTEGVYRVTLFAANGDGPPATQTFTLSVDG